VFESTPIDEFGLKGYTKEDWETIKKTRVCVITVGQKPFAA